MAEIINTGLYILDKIPVGLEMVRNSLTTLLQSVNLPFPLVAGILSLVGSYFFLKQFILPSVFLKLSTILNYVLLSLVFYLVIVYV